MSFSFSNTTSNTKGFSLIELLVVLAIIFILGSVVLFDYMRQREEANLNAAAEGVVATIRQAQSYATGVRAHEGSFDVGYGIRADEGGTEIELHVDANKNKSLQDSADERIDAETFVLPAGFEISRIETVGESGGSVSNADIIFTRPGVAPTLIGNPGNSSVETNLTEVRLTIGKINDPSREKVILINSSGQIGIE